LFQLYQQLIANRAERSPGRIAFVDDFVTLAAAAGQPSIHYHSRIAFRTIARISAT